MRHPGSSRTRRMLPTSRKARNPMPVCAGHDRFSARGELVEMSPHLKIGVVDDQHKSIQVYFDWLPGGEKVVTGRSGAYLPVTSH